MQFPINSSKKQVRVVCSWLIAEHGPLREQAARGWAWTLLSESSTRLASLIKLSILGHLLSPSDYGIFGVAALLLQWLVYFTQTGLESALIQRAGRIEHYLNAFWTTQVVRGVGLTILLFAAAPLGAAFFHAPGAVSVIRLIAIGPLISGLRNPGVVYLRKELRFRKDAVWRSAGGIFGLLVAVPLAFALRSVWALAISFVVADLAETATSYWIHPYRPRICLSWQRLRELTSFGKWIAASNVLAFWEQYMDSLIVGRLLGAGALGLYQVAGQIALMPTAQVGAQVRGVLFPVFSKIGTCQHLRRPFINAVGVLSIVVIPAACLLTVFADPVVRIALGPNWRGATPFLRVLVWAGVLKALGSLANALVLAAGRPRVVVQASLINIAAFAALFYPLIVGWQVLGAALALSTASTIAIVYYAFVIRALLDVHANDLFPSGRTVVFASAPFLAAVPFALTGASWMLNASAICSVGISSAVVFVALRSHFHLMRVPDRPQTTMQPSNDDIPHGSFRSSQLTGAQPK